MKTMLVIQRNPVVFALAMLAAAALVLISEVTYEQSSTTVSKLAVGQAARVSLRDVKLGMLEAENAQRGLLLSGREPYRAQSLDGAREARESLTELARHYQAKPEKLHALTDAVQTKLAQLSQTLALHDGGQRDAVLAQLQSDTDRLQMNSIQAVGVQLMDIELELREARLSDLQGTLMLSRVGVAAVSFIGLIALFLFLRQGSIAENHRLQLKDMAQLHSDHLESQVVQRTGQLIERTAQLTDLTTHLQTAREDERHRLARNLHDELGALLTSAKLDAARIKSRLADTAPEAQERLAHLVQTLNASIALGRGIIEDLRPSTLSTLGLVPTLNILAEDFTKQSGVQTHTELDTLALDAKTELVIYRLVQEAINNLSKYAHAGQVWISMRAEADLVHVSVRDDGQGFDASTPARSAFGLVGMRFRVEAAGGSMRVISSPGEGTELRVTLPLTGVGQLIKH